MVGRDVIRTRVIRAVILGLKCDEIWLGSVVPYACHQAMQAFGPPIQENSTRGQESYVGPWNPLRFDVNT